MAFEPIKMRAKGSDIEYYVNSAIELNNRIGAGDSIVKDPAFAEPVRFSIETDNGEVVETPKPDLPVTTESVEPEDKPKPGRPRKSSTN